MTSGQCGDTTRSVRFYFKTQQTLISHLLVVAWTFRGKIKRGTCGIGKFLILRRDRDSNPGTDFVGYTISNRASSASRASLLAITKAPFTEAECKGNTTNSKNLFYTKTFLNINPK